ncbi:MAG: hypothetical protein IE891_01475 [Flavobacteriaceae bacterium]|nr:hypothetical protein [Flavobacteriaceae bacterium]
MDNFYSYSVLKYRHSVYLDESINVGVLIYFFNENRLIFKHAQNLNRLKLIYSNPPERVINHLFKVINEFTLKYNSSNEIRNLFFADESAKDFDLFIDKEILKVDSNSLYFTKSRLVENENLLSNKIIIDDLVSTNIIEIEGSQKLKSKETFLLKRFYDNLDGLDFERINRTSKKFYKDYILKNETGTEFKFDYAWQNGTLNLVKPLSFDLKDSRNIADKAYRNLGQFIDLQDEARDLNLRYDLLIAKPENKSLFKEYDHAINLLSRIDNSSLVFEEDIDNYSKKAIKALIESNDL